MSCVSFLIVIPKHNLLPFRVCQILPLWKWIKIHYRGTNWLQEKVEVTIIQGVAKKVSWLIAFFYELTSANHSWILLYYYKENYIPSINYWLRELLVSWIWTTKCTYCLLTNSTGHNDGSIAQFNNLAMWETCQTVSLIFHISFFEKW